MTTAGEGLESAPSIQELLYPSLQCFGCGPANARGLRLRSFADAERPAEGAVVARFTPWPEHDNGLGYLNGGIICTLLDCHSAAAVLLEASRRGFTGLRPTDLSFVTAGLDVQYLRPAPLREPVDLRAWLASADEAQMTAEVELTWDGKVRAVATARWKRWRPR